MTRTGTQVIVRWFLAAALATGTGIAAAENLPSLDRSGARSDGWTTSGVDNPFRNGRNTAAAWQPTRGNAPSEAQREEPRNERPSGVAKPAPTAAPTKWLAPNSRSSRSAKSSPSSTHAVSPSDRTARTPKPFAAPHDARRISKSAPRDERPVEREIADAPVRPNMPRPTQPERVKEPVRTFADGGADLYRGSAAIAEPPVKPVEQASNRSASRPAPRRVAHRPQPTPATSRSLFDAEGWIRPLRQVAYQVGGGEEEMPIPQNHKSVMSGNHGGNPNMPNSYYLEGDAGPYDPAMMGGGMPSDGWIGPPGGCCDGSCGPDGCCCGPMCGDTCEPGCGCSNRPDDVFCVGVGDDESCSTVRVRVPKPQEIQLFGGVHGFKGPFDQYRDSGNFGFQEGVNIGAKLPFTDWGYQLGYMATQSQLSGDADTGIRDPFTQHFYTTGIFHRTANGLQGGAVWDLLLDSRYNTTDFHQIRFELSYVECGCHEFGVMGAVHLADEVLFDAQEEVTNAWQSTDQYLLFYRMHGKNGGEGRFFAGLTDDADAVVGADFLLPLTNFWSLQTGFTYLIPEEPAGEIAARQEAWNLGINLVWNWKGRARECHSNPYRPLFNVADNGSLILDDRP